MKPYNYGVPKIKRLTSSQSLQEPFDQSSTTPEPEPSRRTSAVFLFDILDIDANGTLDGRRSCCRAEALWEQGLGSRI